MRILRSCPRSTELETLGGGPSHLGFRRPPGDVVVAHIWQSPIFTNSRVTFPSLVSQQCFRVANRILPSFSSRALFSVPALCEHTGPFSPRQNSAPRFLFRPPVEMTFTKSGRSLWVTSISLSPAGEGSLLRFDRPRSFPSEARCGLSVSPSFAGVEGPLCVLYSPGVGEGRADISEAWLSVSSHELLHQNHLTPKWEVPKAAEKAKIT